MEDENKIIANEPEEAIEKPIEPAENAKPIKGVQGEGKAEAPKKHHKKKKVQKSERTKRTVFLIVAAVVLILAIILLFRSCGKSDLANLEDDIKAQLGQLENKSNEEVQAALDEIIEQGMIRVSINMNPVFPSGSSNGTLQIENHPNNHYNLRVVITCDYDNDGEDEQIYHSGLMPINSHIQEDVLDVVLSAGNYDATATFTAYDVEKDTEVGQVISQIRISVLS